MGSYQNCTNGGGIERPRRLTSSSSFQGKKIKSAAVYRAGSEVVGFVNVLHGSDPVRLELARLGNEVREKERELGDANAEIKALKHSERLKEKAVVELTDKLREVVVKSKATEALLETKNLEIKKINEEKKSALAAQFAAEGKLRRVHSTQKDGEMPPIEAIIAPLEAELKLARLEEEKRVLDRELARAKVSAERVAVVVANDWKDANDKVMPVKQWLEERKFYQGEMQRLRDKLAISERAAKAESKLKDKYQLRFKVLEERLKSYPKGTVYASSLRRSMSNSRTPRLSLGGPESLSRSSTIGSLSRNDNFYRSSKISDASTLLKQAKNLSSSFDGDCRLSINGNMHSDINVTDENQNNGVFTVLGNADGGTLMKNPKTKNEDYVSGTLYDMLQKEVITLRKACHEKDQSLKDKDDSIEILAKKVETLNKAMEVEAKKMRREVAVMEKEFSAMHKGYGQDQRKSNTLLSRNGR